MTRPIILVSPDEEDKETRRGPVQHHHIEKSYLHAVLEAGGLPVVVPYASNDEAVADYLSLADGILLTGGDFDIDPSLFGEKPHEKLGTLKPRRTALERRLYEAASSRNLPLLCICGGMQLVCALRGGSLWQDIKSQRPTTIEHEQVAHKSEAGHEVSVAPGTLFAKIVGDDPLPVNSTHHQAIRELPAEFIASAICSDGIIEAFEDPAADFCLAVQWHPEAMPHERQRKIYAGFIDACRTRAPSQTTK